MDTAIVGWEVYNRKRIAYYAIVAVTAEIIKAIINDENKIIKVPILLDGEYKVFSEVLSVLNSEGVKEVVEIDMAEDELRKFKALNEIIREYINKLNN